MQAVSTSLMVVDNNIDFKISGPTISPVFHVYVSENRIRIKDHLAIGNNDAVSHADAVNWGLAVTGSSLFYSGGTTNTNTNAYICSWRYQWYN